MSPTNGSSSARLSIAVVGNAMSFFLVISFLLCIAAALVFNRPPMHEPWLSLTPGVLPLSFTSALLGVVETFVYGWFVALVLLPVYNLFVTRRTAAS